MKSPKHLDAEHCAQMHTLGSAEMVFHRKTCAANTFLDLHRILVNYDEILYIDPVRMRVKSVLFTDCANAYSSISSITAGSADKAMRLHLAYIRDNAATNILSFCDAVFNLSDAGTKLGADAVNWRRFISTGVFHVSFIGRKASIALHRNEETKTDASANKIRG